MRIFKSLLVSLIGLTALLYSLQNLSHIDELHSQIELGSSAIPSVVTWAGFALITLLQFAIAATALKGGWSLYAARKGSPDEFKAAKTIPVWAGGLSLLSWFALSLMVGAGLFQWGSEFGAAALAKAFSLGTTGALTILFVWGTTD